MVCSMLLHLSQKKFHLKKGIKQMNEYDIVTRTLKKKRYQRTIKPAAQAEVAIEEKKPELEVQNSSQPETVEVTYTEEKKPSYRMKKQLMKEKARERERLLQEYEERINEDGYYNEMLPADSGSDFKPKVKHEWWKYVLVGGLFLFGIAMIVGSIGELIG